MYDKRMTLETSRTYCRTLVHLSRQVSVLRMDTGDCVPPPHFVILLLAALLKQMGSSEQSKGQRSYIINKSRSFSVLHPLLVHQSQLSIYIGRYVPVGLQTWHYVMKDMMWWVVDGGVSAAIRWVYDQHQHRAPHHSKSTNVLINPAGAPLERRSPSLSRSLGVMLLISHHPLGSTLGSEGGQGLSHCESAGEAGLYLYIYGK